MPKIIDKNKKKFHSPVEETPGRIDINDDRMGILAHNLAERVKELNCLYNISRLFENDNLSIEDILRSLVSLIPPAWQYPNITCARIKLDDQEFKTANFRETYWKQAQNIIVDNRQYGVMEIFYLEGRPDCDEGPFLKEERNLLQVIAERLGHFIEHKLAEDNLQSLYTLEHQLREQLQTEMKHRIDLTRKLIHELKTPLTTLIASSQLLYDEEKNQNLQRIAKQVWGSASELNNRIEELHDMVKGEIGALKLVFQSVDVAGLLRTLVDETSALAKQYHIAIELVLEDPLPIVRADANRIRQVLLNLINNSCKYARSGGKINLRAIHKEDAVLIEVRDYGPGISPQKQSQLFQPEYQFTEHNELASGLGIGLILCKMLVELHGGRIWLKSKVGKGTSVFFSLPINPKI
jgi:signal transduction histidine kinase